MSDNLAGEMFFAEPEEHDQESVCAMEVRGSWFNIIPGSLDLIINEYGAVDFIADTIGGGNIEGALTDISGLRSLPAMEPDEE